MRTVLGILQMCLYMIKTCSIVSLGFECIGSFSTRGQTVEFTSISNETNIKGVVYALSVDCEIKYIGRTNGDIFKMLQNYKNGNFKYDATWNRIHNHIVKTKGVVEVYVKQISEDIRTLDFYKNKLRNNETLDWDS